MFHEILQGLTKQVSSKLSGWSIDPVKTTVIVTLAKDTVVNGLRTHAAVFSTKNLLDMFRKDEPLDKTQIAKRMIADYKADLVSLVDLRTTQAEDVSKFVIPLLLLMISHKVNRNPTVLDSMLVVKEDRGILSRFKFWGFPSLG